MNIDEREKLLRLVDAMDDAAPRDRQIGFR
jgi:hypothetical protein